MVVATLAVAMPRPPYLTYNDLLARVYNKEHFLSMKICDNLLYVVAPQVAIVTLSAAKGLTRWLRDASLRSA